MYGRHHFLFCDASHICAELVIQLVNNVTTNFELSEELHVTSLHLDTAICMNPKELSQEILQYFDGSVVVDLVDVVLLHD